MADEEKKSIFKRWWFWVIVLAVIGAMAGGGRNGGTSSSGTSSANSAPSAPDPVMANRPADQTAFIQAVEQGQTSAKSAKNDMQKGGAKASRDKAMCAAIKSMTVNNWTGTLATIDSNSDGMGVVSIRIARDVHVKTWNNSFSDIGDKTLLEPGSDLFNKVSGMSKRTKVKFSGSFIAEEDNCVKESSMTLDGKLEEPEFIFRFSDISSL